MYSVNLFSINRFSDIIYPFLVRFQFDFHHYFGTISLSLPHWHFFCIFNTQITMEKSILEQANSKYELQGEYVFPGTRDRFPVGSQSNGFIEKAMGGHLGSIMSSMGRWRMRLEVPGAEVAEMLPLARLLSRSTDPVIRSRSKVHIWSLKSPLSLVGRNTCWCLWSIRWPRAM